MRRLEIMGGTTQEEPTRDRDPQEPREPGILRAMACRISNPLRARGLPPRCR